MPQKKHNREPNDQIIDLLKKGLVLHLFEMGISQGEIGKKLKINKLAVNAFLKGIKRKNNKDDG